VPYREAIYLAYIVQEILLGLPYDKCVAAYIR
jgi:hypothetical protein